MPTDDAFDMELQQDVMVPARDGVLLATDLYRPARDGKPLPGPFPVILERTPYGKARTSRSEIDHGAPAPQTRAELARYFVARGYVVAFQDCRGRFGSGGRFEKYLSEGVDGADTIAWLRKQPWCDGRIGMMGLSYAAHTQLAAGCLGPQGLASMLLDCGGFSSGYHWGMRQGGALELRQATWAFNQAKESFEAKADPLVAAALEAEDIGAWFKALPWKPGLSPLRWVPDYEDYLFAQWRNGDFGPYWRQNGIHARDRYDVLAGIAQLHLTGWYDTYIATAVENFHGVVAHGGAAAALVIGPWTHGDRALSFAGDVDFGAEAPVDGNLAAHWRAFRLDWFDRTLKGQGAPLPAPVRYFRMGGGPGGRDAAGRLRHGGSWFEASAWPPPEAKPITLLLGPDGTLAPERARDGSRSYLADPKTPVPTIGGAFSSGQPLFFPGAYDQRESERFFASTRPGMELAARPDILVFRTAPLAVDVSITGPVLVTLFVSSDAPDTDFTAKLIDEYPPGAEDPRGFAMNLTDGILRCRYRDSWETPAMMQPGRIYRITIEVPPTANLFRAGHRIRLDIASSNFPKFDVNPNSGEPPSEASLPRIATNTVHMDPGHPSSVTLMGSWPA